MESFMRTAWRWICWVSLLTYTAGLFGQTESEQLKQLLDPLIEKGLYDDPTPGLAVGVVHNGRLVYARGFGVMKLGHPEKPVTPETLFHMASITKPFVATCVMQLWESTPSQPIRSSRSKVRDETREYSGS
jgi:CubicO group peptidase (beta-lactamase class C family)